jgi:hypothetical protein
MAGSQQEASAAFRAHLESLVRSTSAGALCDTDEEALLALEQKYASQRSKRSFTDADVEEYLQSQWQDLEDNTPDEADHRDEQAQEPEVLQWLRQCVCSFFIHSFNADTLGTRTIPSSANYDSVASLLGSPSRTDDEIVSDLLDLIGFDHIDLLPTLISRRTEIKDTLVDQSAAVSS